MWIVGSGLVGRVVPSLGSSCFRSSSSGRHRARSVIRSSTPATGNTSPSDSEFLRRGEPTQQVNEAQRR